MQTYYPHEDNMDAVDRYHTNLFNIAATVADMFDDGENQVIDFEWAVEQALHQLHQAGKASAPAKEIRILAIQIEEKSRKKS